MTTTTTTATTTPRPVTIAELQRAYRDVLDGLGADPDPAVPVPRLPAVTPEELAGTTLDGPLWFLTTRDGAARLAGGALGTSRPIPLATGSTGPVLVRVAPRRPAG